MDTFNHKLGCACSGCGKIINLSDHTVESLAALSPGDKFTHNCTTCGPVERILSATEKERMDAAKNYPGEQQFVHLHNHTIYSALDGVAKPEEYMAGCKECNQPAFAITDHGSVAAIPDAYFSAKKNNIKMIAGCFLPTQDLLTSNGVINICNVKVGDFVLTDKCEWKRVVNVQIRKYSGDVIETSAWGVEKIISTPEHPFLTREVIRSQVKKGVWKDDINLKWIKAANLERLLYNRTYNTKKSKNRNSKRRFKHYLSLPRIIGNGIDNLNLLEILEESYSNADIVVNNGVIQTIKHQNKYSPVRIVNLPIRLELDEEFLWICGLWLAEGSFKRSSKNNLTSLEFSLGYDELKFATRIKDYFNKLNINVNIKDRRLSKNSRNAIDVTVYSAYFARIFFYLFGEHFDKKQIPFLWLNKLSNEQKKFLLNGLFDGDAKINKYNSTLKLCNKTLIWQSRLLMWSLGYTSAISKIKNNNSDNFGYSIRYRNHGHFYYDVNDKYIFSPVYSTKKSHYSGFVYNIEVEQDNSYCVGPIVHNCEIYLNDFEPEFKEWQLLSSQGKNSECRIPILREHSKFGTLRADAPELESRFRRNRHLTVLAKNQIGYQNLIAIQNIAWEKGFYYKPRIWYDLLRDHKEGLIVLSGCLNGPICHELREESVAVPVSSTIRKRLDGTTKLNDKLYAQPKVVALEWIKQFREDFGDDFYLEIQMPGESVPNGRRAFKMISDISRKLEIKTVLSGDCHYLSRDDYNIQMVMMAVDQDKKVDDPTLFHVNSNEQFFKTRSQFRKQFIENKYNDLASIAEFEYYCDNTLDVASKCEQFKPNLEPKLPDVGDADRELVKLTLRGLKEKGLADKPEYVARMKLELQRFIEKEFSSYFLITADLCNKSREFNSPTGPARGSAGGSLVCYLLGIHEMDPIQWDLSFDRFLSPSRGGYMLNTTMG